MRFLAALTLLACISSALAGVPKRRKMVTGVWVWNIDHLLSRVSSIKRQQTMAYTLWIQLVDDKLASKLNQLFKDPAPYTLLVPNDEAWDAHLTSMGANTTDIESLTTKEWRAHFTDLYPYLFFDGILNTTAVEVGETVILDSYKRSPVGDWPLTVAFRRDASLEPNATAVRERLAFPYNGTFYSNPYGSGDVIIPDRPARGFTAQMQVVDFLPTIPKNLSVTVADLNVTGWDELVKRSPIAAGLETSLNYTLLLPPSDAIASALAGSDAEVTAFVQAHLVPERIVLSSAEKTFTTQAGVAVTATSSSVMAGNVNATVINRDVLTNGIIVQVIERALIEDAGSPTPHTEL
ncbi:hypothetical protein JCM11251_002715 [Rhodosporidiobolus azoricus]